MFVTLLSLALLALPALAAEVAGTVAFAGRSLPNAVVWLDAPNAPRPAQTGRVVLDQRNLDFAPRVLVVQVGTIVDFPNNDRVFHNVFSFRDGKKFDLGMYPAGSLKRLMFDKPGLSRVFCNIHPNMAAYIMAVETPYFAVSDEDGAFTIGDIPAGSYTYYAWRPGGTTLSGSISVGQGTRLEIKWP